RCYVDGAVIRGFANYTPAWQPPMSREEMMKFADRCQADERARTNKVRAAKGLPLMWPNEPTATEPEPGELTPEEKAERAANVKKWDEMLADAVAKMPKA